MGNSELIEPEAFLFDVDGTLVDSLPAIIRGLGDAYQEFSGIRPTDEALRGLVGIPLREQMRMYRDQPANDAQISEMCAFTIDRFEAYSHLEREFEPAVRALKRAFDASIPTALVTSKSTRELNSFLGRFSGATWISATVCSSDVIDPKPFPDSAIAACSKLGVDPGNAVFIGDSVHDMLCASRAGTIAIGVSYGAASARDLSDAGANLIFDTPDLLYDWVDNTICHLPCLEKS